jgi:hypothetical protein
VETPPQPIVNMPHRVSISLQPKAVASNDEVNVVKEQELLIASNPFTVEDLEYAWKRFAEKITDRHMIGLIQSSIPRLVSDYVFEVTVFNGLQEKEYRNVQPDLVAFIRKELKNSNLQMNIRLIQETEAQRSISPEDRYKQMLEQNPAIDILRSGLQMEID